MGLARLLRRQSFLPWVSTDRLEALASGSGARRHSQRVTKRHSLRMTKRRVSIERAGRQIAGGELTSDPKDER
ncbi:MAG: hypothetical protein ACTHJK_14670 [Sphingomicrobium sp.]